MEKMEAKFWILLDCLWYGQWFINASITTLLCWAALQDIFMYLENVGTTYKTAMDALDNYFEPKTIAVFERYVFCQAIQETKEP